MAKHTKGPTKGGLTPEQSSRVRDAVEKLAPRYKNETMLAKAIGAEQSTINKFRNGKSGTSYNVAAGTARLLGIDVNELLDGAQPAETSGSARDEAVAILRRMQVGELAIDALAGITMERSAPVTWWVQRGLHLHEDMLRGYAPMPAASPLPQVAPPPLDPNPGPMNADAEALVPQPSTASKSRRPPRK